MNPNPHPVVIINPNQPVVQRAFLRQKPASQPATPLQLARRIRFALLLRSVRLLLHAHLYVNLAEQPADLVTQDAAAVRVTLVVEREFTALERVRLADPPAPRSASPPVRLLAPLPVRALDVQMKIARVRGRTNKTFRRILLRIQRRLKLVPIKQQVFLIR